MEKVRIAYTFLIGNPDDKRLLAKFAHTLYDNSEIGVREILCACVGCIQLASGSVFVGAFMFIPVRDK
jgi:hypothetical protein